MGVWVNWGLVVAAIAFIFGDLVLEVYETVNLAVLGMFLLAGGILGLAIDSAIVGLAAAMVLAAVYLVVHRRQGHMLPKHVSGHQERSSAPRSQTSKSIARTATVYLCIRSADAGCGSRLIIPAPRKLPQF